MALCGWLKQSTAVTVKVGPFVDATDGFTTEDALTISQADIRLAKNGGNMAQTNNAAGATVDENGCYDVPLDTTDTDTLGLLTVVVNETGARPVRQDYLVVPANVWDSYLGADRLQVHAAEISNDLITAAAIADNAIDAGAIAADAITAAKIANGAIDAATFAAGAIDAAAIADGAIDAATFAAGAITADAIADAAIDRATFAADTGLQTIRSNTAQAGAAGTITLDAAASATDDFYNGLLVKITGGTGVGQTRLISDYVGATKVASVSPNWSTNPDNTSTFAILDWANITISAAALTSLAQAVRDVTAETAGTISLGKAVATILSLVSGVSDGAGEFSTPDGTAVRAAFTYSGQARTAVTLTPPTY